MKNLKKKGKMLLCLTLALTTLAGLLVIGATKNWTDATLGDLSHFYETAGKDDPGQIIELPGDSGGKSYGIFMFASKPGTPFSFAQWMAKTETYKEIGNILVNAYEKNSAGEYYPGYGSNFDHQWKTIATNQKDFFTQAQKDYWKSQHYDVLVSNLESKYGFDVDDYSIAFRNVLWSRSIQHGSSAYNMIVKAFDNRLTGGFTHQSEAELITAIYAESGKRTDTDSTKMTSDWAAKYGLNDRSLAYYSANSGSVQEGVYSRLCLKEPYDALVMLNQNSTEAPFASGQYIIKDRATQAKVLTAGGSASGDTADVDNKLTLSWYAGSENPANGRFYTITNAAGQRLTAGDTAAFAAPANTRGQFWRIAGHSEGGWTLQSVSTGNYITVDASGALTMQADATAATAWELSAQADVSASLLVMPGVVNSFVDASNLTQGDASFPLRGVLTSAKPIVDMNVTVKKINAQGQGVIVSACTLNWSPCSTYVDLWDWDSRCKFSQLTEGNYQISVTATTDNYTKTFGPYDFSVAAPRPNEPTPTEKVTVTFKNGDTVVATKQYEVGQMYGEAFKSEGKLPEVTKTDSKFLGWFLEDGSQIAYSTYVVAEDHTVNAGFGVLNTVTFKPDNSTADTVKHLAEGTLIVAPEAPSKVPNDGYKYVFSHWEDTSGNHFKPGETFMGSTSILYTAVYTKTEIPAPEQPPTPPDGTTPPEQPPTPTGPVDGGYMTNITPATKISSLTAVGYTVYSGDTQVTSGDLKTGMTAVANNVSMTIVVTGDTNGDGALNVMDVLNLRAHVLEKKVLKSAYAEAADLNTDGKVNISDVLLATQYALGKKTFN